MSEFEVLMAMVVKVTVFRDVTPRSLIDIYQRFGGTCLHLQTLKMEAASSSETSVPIY
jgi:hypothetical protein